MKKKSTKILAGIFAAAVVFAAIPTLGSTDAYGLFGGLLSNSNSSSTLSSTKGSSDAPVEPTVKGATAPTPKTGLVYNGSSQLLVESSSLKQSDEYLVASEGKVRYQYRLSGSDQWSLFSKTTSGSSVNPVMNKPYGLLGQDAGPYTMYYRKQTYSVVNTYKNKWGITVKEYDWVDNETATVYATIDKATPTATVTVATGLTYNGSPQNLISSASATFNGSDIGAEFEYSIDGGAYTSSATATTKGTHTIAWRTKDSNNFNRVSGSTTVEIAEVLPKVTITPNSNLTYTGKSQNLIASASTDRGTLQYSVNNTTDWKTDINKVTRTNAGTYTVYYKVDAGTDYSATSGSFKVTIAKADFPESMKPTARKGLIYNGEAQELIDASKLPSDATAYYIVSTVNRATVEGQAVLKKWSTDIPTATNADKYYIGFYVSGGKNYNDYEYVHQGTSDSTTIYSMSIGKATPTITIVPSENLKYNGQDQALISSVDKVYGGDYSFAFKSESASEWTSASSMADVKATAVGTYDVKVTVASGDNWNSAEKTAKVTISRSGIFPANALTLSQNKFEYKSGTAVGPGAVEGGITVTADGTTLVNGTDYEIVTDTANNIQATATDKGTYTVKVVGKGTYAGQVATATWEVTRKLVDTVTSTAPEAGWTYDGESHVPSFTVKDSDGNTLTANTDYSVVLKKGTKDALGETVTSAVNAGTYTAVITGAGEYDGTIYSSWTIGKADYPTKWLPKEVGTLRYTSRAQALIDNSSVPEGFVVTYKVKQSGTSAKEYTEVPTATDPTEVSIYSNSYDITFQIAESENYKGVSYDTYTYETSIKRAKILKVTLKKGYTYTYDGNEHGFTISEDDIEVIAGDDQGLKDENHRFVVPIDDLTNTSRFKIEGSKTATDVGEYKVKFTPTNVSKLYDDYEGSSVTWKIVKADLTGYSVNAKEGLVYNGAAQDALSVSGIPEGVTLSSKVEGGEYQAGIVQLTDAGKYKVYYKLDGGNNYNNVEEASVEVTIEKASLSSVEFNETLPFKYTGSEQNVSVKAVKAGPEGALIDVASGDYEVTGDTKGTECGTYTVTVTAKSDSKNFKGQTSGTWAIDKTGIFGNGSLTIKGAGEQGYSTSEANFDFTGSEITPEFKVVADGSTLVLGTDYEVVAESSTIEATKAGTYTIKVKGIGEYAAEGNEASATWTINPVAIGEATASYDEIVYTGSSLIPTITVKNAAGTATLVENEDYTVAITDSSSQASTAVEEGTYTATITGKGNYSGTTSVSWVITKDAAAQVGDTKYVKLATALAAAKAGDTLTLLKDADEEVAITKDITVDGNGFGFKKAVSVSGTVTFTSVVAKKTVTAASGASLTISGGSYADIVADGSTVVINGAEVSASTAITATNGAQITIKGESTIKGTMTASGTAKIVAEDGLYSKDPTDFLVTGYVAVEEEGMYTIKKGIAVEASSILVDNAGKKISDKVAAIVGGGYVYGEASLSSSILATGGDDNLVFVGWFAANETDFTKTPLSKQTSWKFTPTEDVAYVAVYKAAEAADANLTLINNQEDKKGDTSNKGVYKIVDQNNEENTQTSENVEEFKVNVGVSQVKVTYTEPEHTTIYWLNSSGHVVGTGKEFVTTVMGDVTLQAVTVKDIANQTTVLANFMSFYAQSLSNQTYQLGSTDYVTLPTVPERSGYTGLGWKYGDTIYTSAKALCEALDSYTGKNRRVEIFPAYEKNQEKAKITINTVLRKETGDEVVTGREKSIEIDLGDAVDLKEAASFTSGGEKYNFVGWEYEGKFVSYETKFVFVPTAAGEQTVSAVFAKEVTREVTTSILTTEVRDEGTARKFILTSKYAVPVGEPENYSFVRAGVMYGLTDKCEYKYESNLTSSDGTITFTVNGNTSISTVYVKTFVVYLDKDGVSHTVYSDVKTISK